VLHSNSVWPPITVIVVHNAYKLCCASNDIDNAANVSRTALLL
jgi:hypothetical protein